MPPESLLQIANDIKDGAGITAFVLFLGNACFAMIYLMERKDRRDAWRAYNEMSTQTNAAINRFSLAISLLTNKPIV